MSKIKAGNWIRVSELSDVQYVRVKRTAYNAGFKPTMYTSYKPVNNNAVVFAHELEDGSGQLRMMVHEGQLKKNMELTYEEWVGEGLTDKINICLTGDLPESRPNLTARLVEDGRFNIMTYVNSSTDIVVRGSSGTAKLKKAKDLGVGTMNYYEFCQNYQLSMSPPPVGELSWDQLGEVVNVGASQVGVGFNPNAPVSAVIDVRSPSNHWYDYDKQEVNNLLDLPMRTEIEYRDVDGTWFNVETLMFHGHNLLIHVNSTDWDDPYVTLTEKDLIEGECDLRPVDWDKNAKTPVDLDWLVHSDIDVELGRKEAIGINNWVLFGMGRRVPLPDEQHIRPRLNHWFSEAQVSHLLLSEGFDVEYIIACADVLDNEHGAVSITKVSDCGSKHFDRDVDKVVAFRIKGLKDGYCWPWEVVND